MVRERLTLYCQDCGTVLDAGGELDTLTAIMCPNCHATFRRGQLTADEFVASLMFPPHTPDAA